MMIHSCAVSLRPALAIVLLLAFAGSAFAQATRPAPRVARLDRTKMEDIDGRTKDGDGLRCRPWVREDHRGELLLEDYYIHHITDHKAIFVSATSTEKPRIDGAMWTYSNVIIRNCEIGPITLETRGLHIDAILANGSVEPSVKPTLLVEDVLIHDTNGGVMSILCKDGRWEKIILRRVECVNTAHPIIIGGPQGDVLIEDCPGLRVAIQGEPGSVGTVTVRRSPGAAVSNVRDGNGTQPGARIVIEGDIPQTQPTTAAPAPAAPPAPPAPAAPDLAALDRRLTALERKLAALARVAAE